MRKICTLLVSLFAMAVIAQDMSMMKPPPEVAKVKFFVGSWRGTERYFENGKWSQPSKATMKCALTMGGRYVEGRIKSQVMGSAFEGLHLLTYDAQAKVYKAWWFDSAAPGAMEMTGNFQGGNKLVMESKPTEIPGMGEATFRATWTKSGTKSLGFKLETKNGDKWDPEVEGSYKRP